MQSTCARYKSLNDGDAVSVGRGAPISTIFTVTNKCSAQTLRGLSVMNVWSVGSQRFSQGPVSVELAQQGYQSPRQYTATVEYPLFNVQFALWVTNSVAQLKCLQPCR